MLRILGMVLSVTALVAGLTACGSTSNSFLALPARPTQVAPQPTATAPATAVPTSKAKQSVQQGRGPGGSIMSTGGRPVALTFDDGPDPVYTPKMLDLLKSYGIKATFCLVGTNVRSFPGLVRRIVAEGHTICNHSWRHRLDLAKQPDAVIIKDLQDDNQAILAAAPNAKIAYFRAPGGNFDAHLVALAAGLGMRSLYWSVDPRDWDAAHFGHGVAMANHVVTVVSGHVRPGSIVLSHDYKKPDTLTAYQTLLPWMKARYTLIPLRV